MKKQELETILDRGDVGPIEDYLHAVAIDRSLPRFAIGMCTLRMEEAGPALRAILARAAEGAQLSEDEAMLLFRGLHILGGARDTPGFQPLLRLLRRPHDEIEFLLGDAITQGLARIVVGMFDGDADALFGMIADLSIDEYIREALLGAVTFMTWEGRIPRDRTRDFLARFDQDKLAPDADQAWIGWLEAIALLGLRDMAPLVHRAWDEGRIVEGMLERRDFEKDLVAAERKPQDPERFDVINAGYIEDVVEALEWSDRAERQEIFVGDATPDRKRGWQPQEPARNPMRHVGRNDPCPCGSGKKAKKCCLASGGT